MDGVGAVPTVLAVQIPYGNRSNFTDLGNLLHGAVPVAKLAFGISGRAEYKDVHISCAE